MNRDLLYIFILPLMTKNETFQNVRTRNSEIFVFLCPAVYLIFKFVLGKSRVVVEVSNRSETSNSLKRLTRKHHLTFCFTRKLQVSNLYRITCFEGDEMVAASALQSFDQWLTEPEVIENTPTTLDYMNVTNTSASC